MSLFLVNSGALLLGDSTSQRARVHRLKLAPAVYSSPLRESHCVRAGTSVITLLPPTAEERREMFRGVMRQMAMPPRPAVSRKRKAPEPPMVDLLHSLLPSMPAISNPKSSHRLAACCSSRNLKMHQNRPVVQHAEQTWHLGMQSWLHTQNMHYSGH